MRLSLLLAAAVAMTTGAAFAQGAAPPDTVAPAGQVPALGQPAAGNPAASDEEPARAPGAKADQGTVLPGAGADSGTTTYYAPSKEAEASVPWPCAQPKVPSIGAATIWSGPDVAQGQGWDDDNAVAELAQKLASRRTSLDEANDLIVDFAKKAGAAKDKQLTKLFVGTLDIINGNRNEILQGIMRYAQGQERLAERMRDESDKISEAQDNATAQGLGLAVEQKNTEFAWDQRIFKERKQALSYVCETPSLLEHRAYEIAKRIQAQI